MFILILVLWHIACGPCWELFDQLSWSLLHVLLELNFNVKLFLEPLSIKIFIGNIYVLMVYMKVYHNIEFKRLVCLFSDCFT